MSVLCSLMSSSTSSGRDSMSSSSSVNRRVSWLVIMDTMNRSRVMSFDNSSGNAHQHRSPSPQRSVTTSASSEGATESMLTTTATITRTQVSIPTTTATISTSAAHSVRRRLFSDPSVDPNIERDERLRYLSEQLAQITRQQQERYNFDFEHGIPLPDRPEAMYKWEPMQASTSQTQTTSATCSCTSIPSRQTSIMGLLPVRSKARTSTTMTSSYGKGTKRPISVSESSEEESDSKRSRMEPRTKAESPISSPAPTSTLSSQSTTSSASSSSSSSSEPVVAELGDDKPSPL